MIVYTIINAFLSPWMDFVMARIMIKSKESADWTVAIGLYNLLQKTLIGDYFAIFCAGGVMSSDIIRAWVQQRLPQVYFVPGQYSSDNAIGVSILAAQGAGLWLK